MYRHYGKLKDKEVTITQVYKTGEKAFGHWNTRGRTPQGYNIYIDGVYVKYVPYEEIFKDWVSIEHKQYYGLKDLEVTIKGWQIVGIILVVIGLVILSNAL